MSDNITALLERNFDRYARNAQLKPGLLIVAPAVVALIAFIPDGFNASKWLGGLIVTIGGTFALAHIARAAGRKLEPLLYESWGGMPSAAWLRHRDTRIDEHTKRRYHQFLQSKIKDWVPPTPESEAQDSTKADALYVSASRWLREYTRDTKKYPRVADENISYGFRRNSLGSRGYGFGISVATLVFSGAVAAYVLLQGHKVSALEVMSPFLSAGLLWYWVIIVKADWVRDAAEAYARALVAACEVTTPPRAKRAAKPKPA
ncbi:MAG: hypothetical protein WB646_08750 [Steroidobacteraceae bacterium]